VRIVGGSFFGRRVKKQPCFERFLTYQFCVEINRTLVFLLFAVMQGMGETGEKCFGPLSYGMSEDAVEDELGNLGIKRIREPTESLALRQTFNNSGIMAWDRIENSKNLQIFDRKSFRGRVVEEDAQLLCYFLKREAAANLGLDGGKGLQAVILIFESLEKDCLKTFENLQAIVSERNGVPEKSVRKYEEPFYKDDGYTETAIKAGKCTYEAHWRHPAGSQAIWLRIGKDMKIMLYYQSSTFGEILDRDLKKKKDLL